MTKFFIPQFVVLLLGTSAVLGASNASQAVPPSPVLIELFTSEGCSSCPPADAELRELDRTQPVAGADLIVLSEHVDYWNHIGWTDPYSSHLFSDRQSAYARHFGLSSVYTPEMVVDGIAEFVGGDRRQTDRAAEKARDYAKVPVHISSVSWDDSSTLRAHVEAGPLPRSSKPAGVYFVVALDHAESQVLRGENQGRRLAHVAVVLDLNKIGQLGMDQTFSQDVRVKLDARRDLSNLRAIAFVQEPGPGRVLGVVQQHVAK
jgi:hypothetical protein